MLLSLIGLVRESVRFYQIPVGSRQSGRSGVRCIMLGSGLGSGRTVAALAAGLDGGWWWTADGSRRLLSRWIFASLASPEIVDLGYENIIKICQKVARSKIVRGTKPLPKRKICKLRIL